MEKSGNDEYRISIISRLAKKNQGDTAKERRLELQACKFELDRERQERELNDIKIQILKVRKKYETTGKKELWDQLATLEIKRAELEQTLYSKHSEYFKSLSDSNLGITHELQERISPRRPPKQKKNFTDPRKPTKFTKLAKHRILEFGTGMDVLYGKNQIMITLTIPGDTEEVKKAGADYSPYIDNSLHQCIRDCKKLYGYKIDYIDVWENMESGKLHKHLCIGTKDCDKKTLRKIAEKIGKQWEKTLDNMATTKYVTRGEYAGCLPGLDMYERSEQARKKCYPNIKTWANHKDKLWELKNKDGGGVFVNIQDVKKSVARYLAKYLSKQSIGHQSADKNFNPARWWQASKNIRDYAKSYRRKITISKDDDKIDILITAIKYMVSENLITEFYRNNWHIVAVTNQKTGKVERKNIKPGKPIPRNSLSVSVGEQFIIYFDGESRQEIHEFLNQLFDILQTNPQPLPENKPKPSKLVNKYNQDETSSFDYRIWQREHAKYWLEMAEKTG